MPLFQREKKQLFLMKPVRFKSEKELQTLIEKNLGEIFNCRFVATEFATGPVHGGIIDTIALSEENNPVIIEYKVVESSQVVNQSLYYLSWINDHKGDFEIAVQKAFPKEKTEVDWSDTRVICITPGYKKYDLHAVQVMGAGIELWQYRLYQNGAFFLEEVFKRSLSSASTLDDASGKNPVMVEAGRKAALTRATGVYTFEQHIEKIEEGRKTLVTALQDYIMNLDESVEEVPKKFYVAYKVSQNFVCMEIQRTKVLLFLKIDPSSIENPPVNSRDMRNTGHYGTGDFELVVTNETELEIARKYINIAFDNIGGT